MIFFFTFFYHNFYLPTRHFVCLREYVFCCCVNGIITSSKIIFPLIRRFRFPASVQGGGASVAYVVPNPLAGGGHSAGESFAWHAGCCFLLFVFKWFPIDAWKYLFRGAKFSLDFWRERFAPPLCLCLCCVYFFFWLFCQLDLLLVSKIDR